jgi:hypothetical protein
MGGLEGYHVVIQLQSSITISPVSCLLFLIGTLYYIPWSLVRESLGHPHVPNIIAVVVVVVVVVVAQTTTTNLSSVALEAI